MKNTVSLFQPVAELASTNHIVLIPNYTHMLHVVNEESAVSLALEAVVNFTSLFHKIAHEVAFDATEVFIALDPYVKDIEYLLSIGVQKVHQAFTLRELLIEWMVTAKALFPQDTDTATL